MISSAHSAYGERRIFAPLRPLRPFSRVHVDRRCASHDHKNVTAQDESSGAPSPAGNVDVRHCPTHPINDPIAAKVVKPHTPRKNGNYFWTVFRLYPLRTVPHQNATFVCNKTN